MSNGDDGDGTEAADAGGADEPAEPDAAASADVPVESLTERLDAAEATLDDGETALDGAETEADLDAVDETLDDAEETLDAVGEDIPEEPDDDEEEETEPEAVTDLRERHDDLESRLSDLRGESEDQRGPYDEDVAAELEDVESTITDSEWTEEGELDVIAAVEVFLNAAGEQLLDSFEQTTDDPEDLAAAVADVREAVMDAGLDPDDDADTIAALLEAADDVQGDLDDAMVWSDLEVREQLRREGFYDVLRSENRKDFPAEWNAIKLHEQAYKDGDAEAVEYILLGLETFDSDFMEENALDSLRRIAPPEAREELEDMAGSRNQDAIEVLGKIGDERSLETLHDLVEGGGVPLRKTVIRAVGAIGSEESTQLLANQLVDDEPAVRSTAARALGRIGDTRAIEPLADVLAEDDATEVRASAAWALNQIGTERAREAVAAYADDRAYTVQHEAEKARRATEGAA